MAAPAGWGFLTGTPLALSLARLLYEIDPLSFGGLAAPPVVVLFGAAGWVLMALTLWASTRGDDIPNIENTALAPLGLLWLYVLTPPMLVDPLRGGVLLAGTLILSGLLLGIGEDLVRWVAAGVGTTAGAAYLLTLQRTDGRADAFEFQVTAPVLGVAHPTGYPLYTLLGGIFSRLPVGTNAARVNLTSAVAAVVAGVLIYLLLTQTLRVHWAVGALGALSAAFEPVLWGQAVVAEVYALHTAFAVAILWVALRILDEPEQHHRLVPVLFLLIGLSLTNHLTTVLLVPAAAAALIVARPRLDARQWVLSVGLLAASLLIYLYIPLRWPALHDGAAMPFTEFIAWVTGSRFGGALQLQAWLTDGERWTIIGRLLAEQYGLVGLIGAAVGLGLLIWQRWQAALVTGLAFVGTIFFGLNYLVPDISVFIIPAYVIAAIWLTYAVHTVYDWLPVDAVRPVVIALFALIPLASIWQVGSAFDWSDERALEAWGRYVLSLPLDENAVILADSEKIAPLEYLRRIEGLREDIDMVVLGTEQQYRDYLATSLAEGRTVYLARFLPGLEGTYNLRSVGPLVLVSPEPLTTAEPTTPFFEPRRWENGLTLLGYDLGPETAGVGERVHLTLYWQVDEPLAEDVQVSVSLINSRGTVSWRSQPSTPVAGRYPLPAWQPGEIVPAYHELTVPYSAGTSDLFVAVSVRAPFAEQPMRLDNGLESRVVLGQGIFTLSNARARVPLVGERTAISFARGAVLAVDLPESLAVRGSTDIQLNWRDQTGDFTAGGRLNTILDVDVPVGFSEPGVRVRVITDQPDENTVRWLLTGTPMRCGWLRPFSSGCLLGETDVFTGGLANNDNAIALQAVDFPEGELQPGGELPVTLTWEALSNLDADYTVSVQLIGPDGRLYGQSDAWPVQGTYPTSAWPVGETVVDRHVVRLQSGAPEGPYQLHVAWYLLSTNARLPVLDETGTPIDSKAVFDLP
ncbi:MAG: DUF2723 domain-containing protein [Anaerolineae bacterium]